MNRIKKVGTKGTTAISTASLPDIVFMLLFFFMAVAVLKTSEPLVEYELPSSPNLYRFENPGLLANIRIGEDPNSGTTRIQLGDAIHPVEAINAYIKGKMDRLSPIDLNRLRAYLEVDSKSKMAIVNKVKQEIGRASLHQVILAAEDEAGAR